MADDNRDALKGMIEDVQQMKVKLAEMIRALREHETTTGPGSQSDKNKSTLWAFSAESKIHGAITQLNGIEDMVMAGYLMEADEEVG